MNPKEFNLDEWKQTARHLRRDILRAVNEAGSGHPGGSLSAVEILLTLYKYKMKHDPQNPSWSERDRLIISKGHITPAVYCILAHCGYIEAEEIKTFRKYGSRLQGHVHKNVPGVEFNTGSLGHGLSVANGMALAARLKNEKHNVYCLMGDGEIQEGSVWEAAMSSSHFKLDNVCAIVDYNKVQENGPTNDIKNLEPLREKWESFGWHAVEIIGHNIRQIMEALDDFGSVRDKPYVIIAHTIKGKGVSFMEGEKNWHGKAPNIEKLKEALEELPLELLTEE